MTTTTPRGAARRCALPSLVLAALVGATSCASPQEVADTRRLAKDYQTQVMDLEKRLAELDLENTQLRERYERQRRTGLVNAGADANLKSRIDDLGAQIAGLDRPVRNVERFEVEGGYLLMIQDKILFDSGSAELGDEGASALRQLASEIAGAPHGKVFVRGHTDSDPVKRPETRARFPHGNLQLSAARAVSVAAFLIEQAGMSGPDVVVMGFGPHKPVGPNNSAEAKRMNRRVEIFVSDPEE